MHHFNAKVVGVPMIVGFGLTLIKSNLEVGKQACVSESVSTASRLTGYSMQRYFSGAGIASLGPLYSHVDGGMHESRCSSHREFFAFSGVVM